MNKLCLLKILDPPLKCSNVSCNNADKPACISVSLSHPVEVNCMGVQHTEEVCEPNLVSTLVPVERGNVDGDIIKRVLAAGSESDKCREKSDNFFKKWCLHMCQVDKKKDGKCFKVKLNNKLEAQAEGFHF
jgi:hypothetical protein